MSARVKVSVILRAAARGATARFDPQQMPQYQNVYPNGLGQSLQLMSYGSRDAERSRDLAGALNGIAMIYEQIEAEEEADENRRMRADATGSKTWP